MTSSPDESQTLDSEWFGQVPASWRVVKFGRSVRLVTEKATQSAFKIALENVESWSGNYLDVDSQDLAGDGVEFLEGDLLFGKLRPYLAKVWLADRCGSAVGDFHVYRPIGYESSYLLYLLVNRSYIEMVNSSTYGSKMPRVSWGFIRNIAQPLPPLDEQRQIAEYLDRETGKIDELITKQEELVATLTERRQVVIANAVTRGVDSGVNLAGSTRPAAGLTPQGWSSDKLSRHFVAKKGSTAALLTREYCGSVAGEFPVFSGQTENGGVLALIDSYEFDSGDQGVLFSTTVGARAMTVRHIFGKFSLSQNCMIIQRTQNANMRFYFYFFQNLFAAKRAELSEHMQASFTMNDLYSFKILLPPLSTQTEIARWLDLEMIKLDDLSAKVSEAIKLLRERRAALISAAVTGKIDVRGL